MGVVSDINSVLRVQGLRKSYNGKAVVNGVDFQVNRGDIVGFIGPNGAGKTTTMSIIAGLQPAEAGEIGLLGIAGGNKLPEVRARIGYLQEKPRIYPEMSARAYLSFFAEIYGIRDPETRIDVLLDRLELQDAADRPLGTYSRGMQQRACLARVLLHDPEFLMLDEPTLGLDPAGVAEMREIFQELSQQGVTLLFSSHHLAEMERMCDRIILMESGKIIAAGRQSDLLPNATDGALLVEIDEAQAKNIGRINAIPEIKSAVLGKEGKMLITLMNKAGTRSDASRLLTGIGLTVLSISNSRQTLEELFLRLTENDTKY